MAKLFNSKYYHRDLSWLRFNHRVLQEAADMRNPLMERFKFLAIFSSNLDEFFKVRVSDIRQLKDLDKPLRKKLITKPNKVLKEIHMQVEAQQEEFGRIFRDELIPELEKFDIHLINSEQFSPGHKEIVKSYYEESVKPLLQIETCDVDSEEEFFIENEKLYLVAFLSDKRFVLVQIPDDLPRFFTFPKQQGKFYITFLDDIMKFALRQHPAKEREIIFYSIKKSRDAELYIENEYSGNLMDKIKNALSQRETGQATRLLVDKAMPNASQQSLKQVLDVSNVDIVQGGRYHNFSDFFGFPNPEDRIPKHKTLSPIVHPEIGESQDLFEDLLKKDQLLHFPYHSFEPVVRLLEQAAEDPAVSTIKITIYRAAEKSRLAEAIRKAALNGKKVVCFIEVKARFDERNNIKWGSVFSDSGAKVIYSFPGIKVHSKILYIERELDGNTQGFAYIGTGNFNEKTAKIYTDYALMTANQDIASDINQVFKVLEGELIVPKPQNLLIAPFNMRSTWVEKINREIEFAKVGKQASIVAKMNSLQDKDMIKLLYEASGAGVKIKLIVRGICCLVPGIVGQSENIEVISILDRYLEHGRVFIFGNDGNEEVYIGSADWMTRNLSHRIEVITPILEADIKQQLKAFVDIQLKDSVKARFVDADQSNVYVGDPAKLGKGAQELTYDYLNSLT